MSEENKRNAQDIINDIKATIENEIAPMLRQDGGDIELISFEDGIAAVKLQGACIGCPMADVTMKSMVEVILKDNVPEIVKVEQKKLVEEENQKHNHNSEI